MSGSAVSPATSLGECPGRHPKTQRRRRCGQNDEAFGRTKWTIHCPSTTAARALATTLLILTLNTAGTAANVAGGTSWNYAAPPPAAPAGAPSSEREMAQLALQELLQLQRETTRNQRPQQQQDTRIWPYSLYEQKMVEIFGEKRKEPPKREEEGLLRSNRPVVIRLPAYRNASPLSSSEAAAMHNGNHLLFSTSQGDQQFRAKPTPSSHSIGAPIRQRPNPIRPQSSRWRHMYSTAGGGKELSQEENSRPVRTRQPGPSRHASAEKSLITRPGAMFLPAHHHNRPTPHSQQRQQQQRQQFLRPIHPVNVPPGNQPADHSPANQLFIKRIASAPPMPSGNNAHNKLLETELMDDNRRFAPPPNSVVVPSGLPSAPSSNIVGPFQAPLAGSPFDFLASSPGASNLAAGAQPNALLSQLPNPLQLLSQGTTLEQITSLARNLIQMGNGNQDILSSLTKAIGSTASADGPASKLTSTAVQAISKTASKVAAAGERTAVLGDGVSTLFSTGSNGTNGTDVEQQQKEMALNGSPTALLNGLPAEQRTLLEAALRNGELDPAQTAKALSSGAVDFNTNTSVREASNLARGIGAGSNSPLGAKQRLISAEGRLMEWIQQNRPRHAEPPPAAPNGPQVVGPNAERLPYYGRYCGSFVEQTNSPRQHNIAGAVWAVDERRLLISKFHFQPLEHSENITLWAGPANHSATNRDFLPSDNGFFVAPEKLNARTFALGPIQRMPANVRAPISPIINGRRDNNGTSRGGGKPAEGEEEEDELEMNTNMVGRMKKMMSRMKRNLYNELYGQLAMDRTQPMVATDETTTQTTATTTTTTTTGPSSSSNTASMAAPGTTVVPIHFGGTAHSFRINVGNPSGKQQQQQPKLGGAQNEALRNIDRSSGIFTPTTTTTTHNDLLAIDPPLEGFHRNRPDHWSSLEWLGGEQPLLITLPPNRPIKTLNWLAVWDHTQKQALALVLIPTPGVAFQVPSTVQLRPLPPPTSGEQLRSGPIRVLDTKTIELSEFSLRTDGVPLWFMVGKEILPNQNGHIVPIYNRNTQSVDCDSLRDFHNETVTLRLPDPLDIKDVFWFSVYSIPRGQSLSHIYIPYNDMQLPPDLLALPTPQCTWTSPPPPAAGGG